MKRFVAFLLALLFALSTFSLMAFSSGIDFSYSTNVMYAKINHTLSSHLEELSENDLVTVVVWLDDYDDNYLYSFLSLKLGEEISPSSADSFVNKKIEQKKSSLDGVQYSDVADLREKLDMHNQDIYTDAEIQDFISKGMTIPELIDNYVRKEFLYEFRNARQQLNTSLNLKFIDSLDKDSYTVELQSQLFPFVVLTTQKSNVYDLTKNSCVESIHLFEDVEFVNMDLPQDESDETKSSQTIDSVLAAKLDTISDEESIDVIIHLKYTMSDTDELNALCQEYGVDSPMALEAKINSTIREKQEIAKTIVYDSVAELREILDMKDQDVLSDTEISYWLNKGMSLDDLISNYEIKLRLARGRMIKMRFVSMINQDFINSIDLNRCSSVNASSISTSVYMSTTKSYIEDISDSDSIDVIYLLEDVEFVNMDDEELIWSNLPDVPSKNYIVVPRTNGQYNEYGSHIVFGNDSNSYKITPHETLNYDGTGIKVGVLEEEEFNGGLYRCFYNPTNSALLNKTITSYPIENNINPGYVSSHATNVMCIIGGNATLVNNEVYQGLAPGASLYYSNVEYHSGMNNISKLDDAFTWFAQKQVDVLNMSFGVYGTTNYGIIDAMADYYVDSYKIILVAAAGNVTSSYPSQGNIVTSPAKAYNVLTVGNISSDVANSSKYIMNSSSNYSENNCNIPNKPDIVMFGTNIIINGGDAVTGTSYSTPIVSGTIACMLQANNNLIGKPDVVKSILVATANDDVIYHNDDTCVEAITSPEQMDVDSISWDKCGAGLLSIVGAINTTVNNSQVYRFVVNSATTDYYSPYYQIDEDDVIEAALIFTKNTDDGYTNTYLKNYDLQLIDENGNVVFSTNSLYNNVEHFIFELNTSGRYRFRIHRVSSDTNDIADVQYLALTITCGCDMAKFVLEDNGLTHDVCCEGCGFEIQEEHEYLTLNSVIDVYNVTHYLYYKFNKSSITSNMAAGLCCSDVYPIANNSVSGNSFEYEIDTDITYYPNDYFEVREVYCWEISAPIYEVDIIVEHVGYRIIRDIYQGTLTFEFIN